MANPDHLEKLKEGTHAWIEWRYENLDLKPDLREADLIRVDLSGVDLSGVDLSGATLSRARLDDATLREADLSSADLTGASLQNGVLVRTNVQNAVLSGCNIYGVSIWDVNLDGAIQSNLVITPEDQPQIQVDNLQVAQFIYVLLNNRNVREVIDTITSKAVLILGRVHA